MTPFGFTPDGTSDDGADGSPDFAAMMQQMQEQIREQFEKMGMSPMGLGGPFTDLNKGATQEVLPQKIVRDTAKNVVAANGSAPIGTKDVTVVKNATEIADLWLNEATAFPAISGAQHLLALSRHDWVDSTLTGWQATIEPLALGLTNAITELLDQATASGAAMEVQVEGSPAVSIGAIGAVLRSFIGTMIATQLGQSIGSLAHTVTGAHDVGLPLLEPARPILIPENVDAWGKDLEIPASEIYLFHALREGSVARLFAHNPWLVAYMRTAIVEYGKGIHIDIEAIARQAQGVFEEMQSAQPAENAEQFSITLDSGVFTPAETPTQRAALKKLETVLALIDGWAEEVTTIAAAERLPAMASLQETLRRRRATCAPSQQLFSSLLGLHVSPKLSREASAFWQKIREVSGVSERDQIWSGILPTAEDLLTPEDYLSSIKIPDDLSGL